MPTSLLSAHYFSTLLSSITPLRSCSQKHHVSFHVLFLSTYKMGEWLSEHHSVGGIFTGFGILELKMSVRK